MWPNVIFHLRAFPTCISEEWFETLCPWLDPPFGSESDCVRLKVLKQTQNAKTPSGKIFMNLGCIIHIILIVCYRKNENGYAKLSNIYVALCPDVLKHGQSSAVINSVTSSAQLTQIWLVHIQQPNSQHLEGYCQIIATFWAMAHHEDINLITISGGVPCLKNFLKAPIILASLRFHSILCTKSNMIYSQIISVFNFQSPFTLC